MAYMVSGEDSGGRARCRRCGTTGIDTAVEEMRDSNRRDVGRLIWKKWVGRAASDWSNIYRELIPT